jgi:CRISPR-associated protein Cmr1
MRKIPNNVTIPTLLDPKDAHNVLGSLETPELTTWELTLKTITPMFGGSAKTREVDSQNPIRPSSVRGHLRFWWRATAGAGFSSAEELFKAEEKLWGSATVPGLVSLRVKTTSGGMRKNYSDFVTGFGDARGYALFPFAENKKERVVAANCLVDIVFSLFLTFPESLKNDVEQAIAAWVLLGGIGARTRRGCGSLEMTSEPNLQPVQRQFANLLTLIPGQYFIKIKQAQPNKDTPVDAWEMAVKLYRDFRQQPGFAREPINLDTKRPGRSFYPEPDSIRKLSSQYSPRHKPIHKVSGYPRADFGLPIVFQFKDVKEGDPKNYTLQGAIEGQTRFASPVITKAIKTSNGYVPAIIVLNSPHVWENGDLSINREKVTRAKIELTEAERHQVPPLAGKPIREALIEFAKSQGFSKVSL